MRLLLHTVDIYLLLFSSYAILGWCMEVLVVLIVEKKFVNRGFLIGPYCPIYGWGAVLITILLNRYVDDPIALFIFGMVICSLLEYITSWAMEKIFNARWWDYSTKKFNINGRVCLETTIPFGLLGLLIVCVLNPFFVGIYKSFSNMTLLIICVVFSIIFIIDNIFSVIILTSFKKDIRLLAKDNTGEISAKVKEIIANRGWGYKRLLSAFPNVRRIGTILKTNVVKAKNKVEEKQEKIKRQAEEKILILKDEYNFKVKEIKEKAENKLKKIKNR